MYAAKASERGVATVEWVGLLLLVAVFVGAGLAVAGARVPGAELARTIAARIVCAVSLDSQCSTEPDLVAAYGAEVAALAALHAPEIRYERGMHALPVDFRRCRRPACSDGALEGVVWRSSGGEPAVAFVHAIDCSADARDESEASGYDCAGIRAGRLYIQYWLYYPTSSTAKALPGDIGFHLDDWESYQVRVRPGGVDARASSHHDYVYDIDGSRLVGHGSIGGREAARVARRFGIRPKLGWGRATGYVYVSGGSHAGNARADRDVDRITPRRHLTLIPLEPLVAAGDLPAFAVIPPWRKEVWRDPEADGTD